jgi:hypothetical protein
LVVEKDLGISAFMPCRWRAVLNTCKGQPQLVA